MILFTNSSSIILAERRKMGYPPSYSGVDFSLRRKYILINRGGSAHYFLFTPLETIPYCSAAELDIRIIPVEINAPTGISNGVYFFIYFKFPSSKSFLKGDECEKISSYIVMSYFRLRHAHDGRYGYRWDTG